MVLNTTEIGERITILRKQQKLTQTELAHKLNKSLRTVQKYERGEIEISFTVINELAAILNTTVEHLIGCDNTCISFEEGSVLKMTIGEQIRYYRRMAGITQEQLAQLSGIHPVSIRKYETNKMIPQIPQIKKIAKALDVRPSTLIDAGRTALNEKDISFEDIYTHLNDIREGINAISDMLLEYIGRDSLEINVELDIGRVVDILNKMDIRITQTDEDLQDLYGAAYNGHKTLTVRKAE